MFWPRQTLEDLEVRRRIQERISIYCSSYDLKTELVDFRDETVYVTCTYYSVSRKH